MPLIVDDQEDDIELNPAGINVLASTGGLKYALDEELIFEKVEAPNCGMVPLKYPLFNAVHPLNALSPILVTEVGTVILTSLVQLLNELAPTTVTVPGIE